MQNQSNSLITFDTQLKTALKRKHYPLPTIDDQLPELSKARVFSVVDIKNGFWHMLLNDESSTD